VHNHLQRLARVLRLHADGCAWSVVRAHLAREIPRGSWLWAAWMDEGVRSVSGKCLVRMKLEGVYREVSCRPFLFSFLFSFFIIIPSDVQAVLFVSPCLPFPDTYSPPLTVGLRTLPKLDPLPTRREEREVKACFSCVRDIFVREGPFRGAEGCPALTRRAYVKPIISRRSNKNNMIYNCCCCRRLLATIIT
jgi:hypothetical protein